MRRYLLTAIAAVAAIAVVNESANAIMIAMPQPGQQAITVPVVVTGKVTAIEKDTVDAPSPYAGAKDKVAYKVAVVKIDAALSGANNLTHIKIGFIPPAMPDPNVKPPVGGGIRPPLGRPRFQMPELKVGQEMVFFLAKHPTADFYVMPGMNTPIDITTPEGKKTLEEIKKTTAVLADPMKGLKSDKADVRAETAAVMITKYRAYPILGGETEQVAIGADESKLILKALAEAEWKAGRFGTPNAYNAFSQLGLTDKDGWKQPVFPQPVPGAPPVDFMALQKEAFVKWLAGPGKDYVVKKVVAKAPTEK